MSNKWEIIGKGAGGQVASFLIKTIALEAVRRFSRAKCPFIWTGLQGLQVLCYPPLKWIQCWNPFGHLVKGMQMISRPMLVLSIVNALSDHSDCSNFFLDDTENSPSIDDSQSGSESVSGGPSLQIDDVNTRGPSSTNWMNHLCEELERQGITLPERINEEELQRFYAAANGDSSSLLSSVKKTIRWRETYRILSGDELEMWSNMIFWHGLDVKRRPCLIIRLGLACISLPSHDRPRFAQAVVSQVEYGVLHLLGGENPQITVLLDCQGLSSLRLPMQTLRYCCNVFQDHFPNVLGCLIVIRLPSVVRVIAQTFIQVLKPATKQKLRIEGQEFKKVLSDTFQTLPSYLGGSCTCTRCTKLGAGSLQRISDRQTSITESLLNNVNTGNFPSEQLGYQYDMLMDNYCSRTLRSAVIGVLIIWVLIAFIEGIYNPESRPFSL
ncbi:sec14 cytosolic factor [Phtheirospermum japonicum]|uniref:Sec14 cytosolic factor n=1 Tax=Phtheirospermum japonicum TaxID=374723 RepID=A0A830AXD8_9LAMI|nr:sec14 cytosolic factor [Phtheirospermum japonicum]